MKYLKSKLKKKLTSKKSILILIGVVSIVLVSVLGYNIYKNVEAIRVIRYCMYNKSDMDACGASRDINYPAIERIYACSSDDDCVIVESYGERSYESISINKNSELLWTMVYGKNVIPEDRQGVWCVHGFCRAEPLSEISTYITPLNILNVDCYENYVNITVQNVGTDNIESGTTILTVSDAQDKVLKTVMGTLSSVLTQNEIRTLNYSVESGILSENMTYGVKIMLPGGEEQISDCIAQAGGPP